MGEGERGGQRAALSTVSLPVRRRRIVHKLHTLPLIFVVDVDLAKLVQPAVPWGLQARFLADGARAEPLIGSPNSCLNPVRMYKEG